MIRQIFSRETRRILLPGMTGNILEWYDFFLYGFFAPIIAQLFFPDKDKTVALLATFAIYATGYLMRPLGAMLFGHVGDRLGRKVTLITTVTLMAVPTALIGFLPTYHEWGIAASISLLLCRLLQGLAIGGEFGYVIYVIEHAPENHRGLYGSMTTLSACLGTLMASFAAALVTNLVADTNLMAWGWRVPFIFGLVLGAFGLYYRLHMPETPIFKAIKDAGAVVKRPVSKAFQHAPSAIIKAVILIFLPAVSLYILFIYLPTFLNVYIHLPLKDALLINTIGLVALTLFIPFVGYLSDKIGRKKTFLLGALLFLILSYPLFSLLFTTHYFGLVLLQVAFAAMVSLVYIPVGVTLVEMVPTAIRYTSMGFAYNVANSIFGGVAPLLVTYLIAKTQNPFMPAYFLIGGAIILLSILTIMKETSRKPLP